MKRIFIAINLPDEVKDELEQIKQEIISSFPENTGIGVGKWVKKESLHITLLFIGEVKNEKIEGICEKVKQIAKKQQPFEVRLKKVCYGAVNRGAPKQNSLGSFATGQVPRLIWVETEKNKDLEHIARALGNQQFKSHITLSRIKEWQWKAINPDERPDIEQDLNMEFEAKSIDIMESVLTRECPKYSILKWFKLGRSSQFEPNADL